MSYSINTTKTWQQTMSDLAAEFRRWGVTDWHVQGPVLTGGTRTGDPDARRRVVLTWTPKGAAEPLVWTKDTQARAVDNLRVFFLVIEALRLNELRGVSDDMREAYLALGAGGASASPPLVTPPPSDPYEVLQVAQTAPLDVVQAAYRAASRKLGPPSKANGAAYLVINQAFDRIKRSLATGAPA